MIFDPLEKAIADIKAGKMIILVDDADRENEGDLRATSFVVQRKK